MYSQLPQSLYIIYNYCIVINMPWNYEMRADAEYNGVKCPHCAIPQGVKIQKYFVNVEERFLGLTKEARPYSTRIHCDDCNHDYWVNIEPGRRSVQKVFDKMRLQRVSNYLLVGEQKLRATATIDRLYPEEDHPLNVPIFGVAPQIAQPQPQQPTPIQQFVDQVLGNQQILTQIISNPQSFQAFASILQIQTQTATRQAQQEEQTDNLPESLLNLPQFLAELYNQPY